MQRDTKTRIGIAALVYTMVEAVLFGSAVIAVMAVPDFRAHAGTGFMAAATASVFLAAPIAWLIAPRLRARHWRQQQRMRHAYARHDSRAVGRH